VRKRARICAACLEVCVRVCGKGGVRVYSVHARAKEGEKQRQRNRKTAEKGD